MPPYAAWWFSCVPGVVMASGMEFRQARQIQRRDQAAAVKVQVFLGLCVLCMVGIGVLAYSYRQNQDAEAAQTASVPTQPRAARQAETAHMSPYERCMAKARLSGGAHRVALRFTPGYAQADDIADLHRGLQEMDCKRLDR
jgi:hypothetical protein